MAVALEFIIAVALCDQAPEFLSQSLPLVRTPACQGADILDHAPDQGQIPGKRIQRPTSQQLLDIRFSIKGLAPPMAARQLWAANGRPRHRD